MIRRRNDHDIADEIVALLESDEDKARHPDMEARSLIQQARDAGGGGLRMQYLKQAQRAIAKLNPTRHGRLISQLQSEVLALQGRRGDTKVAHVTPGEVVIPQRLQTREVLAALHAAARGAGIDPDRLVVGSGANSINPETGQAEFGFRDWMSELFGGPSSQGIQDESENDLGQAAAQGVVQRAAEAGTEAASVRADYADKVHALGPYGYDQRERLKADARKVTPPEFRAGIEKARPDLGRRTGSEGRANVTNPKVDAAMRRVGMASKGLAGANVLFSLADIATSDNPTRTAVANAGAMVGGTLGGAGGGALGLLGGPLAPVTAPAGALAGSAGGGMAGYKGGEKLYDSLHDLWNKRF